MNAYELADDLQEDLQWIVTLNTDLPSRLASAINMLRQQADRIAELEKILEQEGICVGSDLLNGGIAIVKKIQTKPLSDEEIDSIIYSVDWAYNPVLLVRAIEERHGIK